MGEDPPDRDDPWPHDHGGLEAHEIYDLLNVPVLRRRRMGAREEIYSFAPRNTFLNNSIRCGM